MPAFGIENCDCQQSPTLSGEAENDIRHPLLEAAQKAYALLQAADILTEKPTLSETDVISLDVLIAEARQYVWEIIWLSKRSQNLEMEGQPLL